MLQVNDPYQQVRFVIKPQNTDVYGLRYFPSLEPIVSNDQDSPPFGSVSSIEVSDCNLAVVRQVVLELGNNLSAAVEIGVNRNGERSMSRVIMDDRPKNSFYLGIDIEDKSYLDNAETNTWTIKCDSHDQQTVRNFLKNKSIEKIDLLMIDGWHSVNACVNDWLYADLLSDHGVVVMHDTNCHPGPIALFEAIDERFWIKQRLCIGADHGVAVVKRNLSQNEND